MNPLLNAVFHIRTEAALNEAHSADSKLARGSDVGPLHGVPFTIKDSFDTEGIVTTAGTLGRATHVPEQDATVVARIKAAGAILLGKSNTPEFTCCLETDNLVYGRTNNPFDLARSPGGSSGGAAAIVAAGGAPFDVGSDTGGSIRVPAHFCGVAGIKPTSGRVSRFRHILGLRGIFEPFTQLGPISRAVEDLALVLSVIAGPDWRNPFVVPMPMGAPSAVKVPDLRVAYFTDNGFYTPTDDTIDTVQAAADAIAESGAEVRAALPDGIEQTQDIFLGLLFADGLNWIDDLLERAGTSQPHPWIGEALKDRDPPSSAADIGRLVDRWNEYRATLIGFMEHYDVIVCPAVGFPAPAHGGTLTEEALPAFSYTETFNLTGWPAAVVRCGTSSDGLPIAVQVAARPWREDIALAVAEYLENAFGGWQRSPLLEDRLR